MSQWIAPLFFLGLWLKEYLLSNMTRMELFSSKYDTKNWTFFEYDSKIWIFFLKKKGSQNSTSFLRIWPKNWPFFLNMTQRIEPFISWVWRTELNPFCKSVLNWTFFFLNTTQTFEHVWKIWLKELNSLFLIKLEVLNSLFWIRLKELNPFFWDSKELFFFSKNDSKNCTLFWNKTWLKELEFFYNYFENWGSFEYDSNFEQKLTLRTEPFFFKCDSKKFNLFFSNVTRRIESFSLRLKELNPFS